MWPLILLALVTVAQVISPSATVMLDRNAYLPGERVTIYITVYQPSDVWRNKILWLYIDGPDLRNVLFLQLEAADQTILWDIPADAAEGNYTVTLTWDHSYVQTGFSVVSVSAVPEFSMPVIAFMVCLSLVVVFRKAATRLARRFLAASTRERHGILNFNKR
jgi:hypothetical protein